MTKFSTAFLILVATLFLAAIVRWLRTPTSSPERHERSDLACLLLLIAIGQGGAMARDRFVTGSRGFWFANVLLVPICGFALFYIRRLYLAYRGAPPPTSKPTARVLRPPKLDPPKSHVGSRRGRTK